MSVPIHPPTPFIDPTVHSLHVLAGPGGPILAARSFVRTLAVTIGGPVKGLVADPSRVTITQWDFAATAVVRVLDSGAFSLAAKGCDTLLITLNDPAGLGGPAGRNFLPTQDGDGIYQVRLDVRGDGSSVGKGRFYRLMGDCNGDAIVTACDEVGPVSAAVTAGAPYDPELDTNGDGVVDAADLDNVTRAASAGRNALSWSAVSLPGG